MPFILGTLQSSIQSSVENRKSYNGLTKGKPTRQIPPVTGFLDAPSDSDVRSACSDYQHQQMRTPLRQHRSGSNTPSRFQQASFSSHEVLHEREFTSMLPQQPQRQSTGVIRSTDAALHGSPLTPGVLQDFCEPDTSPLQSAEPCIKRSSHRQTRDVATASPLPCRSLPSGSSYNPNSPLHIDSSMSSRWDFRPIILPQTGYIRGSPFLRGYSKDLQGYGISSTEFLEIVDEINIANVPNPENQLFQKVASVAGWFV
jgi:hypothetical protein